MTPLDTNGWSTYEKLVLDTLERLEKGQEEHTKAIQKLEVASEVSNAKAQRDSRWISGIGAAVGIGISTGVSFLFKR